MITKIILLIALVVLVVGAKRGRHVSNAPAPGTAKRIILSWLVIAALALLLAWTVHEKPKGGRLGSVVAIVVSLAAYLAVKGVAWMVRRVRQHGLRPQ